MYFVYALYSPNYNKIYIGSSSNPLGRLDSHNTFGKKGHTLKYRPWKIVYTERFAIKKDALIREKQLKSAKGREFIWKLIEKEK
jgi:putative endonuclease